MSRTSEPRLPYLPLYTGDFFGATATWAGEERALYLLLLAAQWSSGALPLAPKEIARVVGYDEKAFARLWRRVSPKFDRSAVGLSNGRLEQHRERSSRIAKSNYQKAIAAAVVRHSKSPLHGTTSGVRGVRLDGCLEHNSEHES